MLVVDTLGRAEAPTVAELIADMGRKVEIVTGLSHVGCEMPIPAWHNLMERLLQKNVTLTPFTGVWEIEDGSVDVYNVISWQPRTMEGIDTVVFASGGVPEDALGTALADAVAEVHVIGDCYQPRDIEVAVVDGHRAGPGDRRRGVLTRRLREPSPVPPLAHASLSIARSLAPSDIPPNTAWKVGHAAGRPESLGPPPEPTISIPDPDYVQRSGRDQGLFESTTSRERGLPARERFVPARPPRHGTAGATCRTTQGGEVDRSMTCP